MSSDQPSAPTSDSGDHSSPAPSTAVADRDRTDLLSPRLRGGRPYFVAAIVLVIAGIQLAMPQSVTLGPKWLIPSFEVVGAPLILTIITTRRPNKRLLRVGAGIYLVMIISVTILNAVLLFRTLLTPAADSGVVLLFAGFGVLAINVLSFGLVYWWVDGGGPLSREAGTVKQWDFQFPQQASGDHGWNAEVGDYIFTAYTNIVAFSPTDTMPLTRRVKYMFTVQSSVALITIVVTVSRAINLLPY
ncbi:MAG: hypothetical protein WCP28_16705 [Actinomycetes bacterium]